MADVVGSSRHRHGSCRRERMKCDVVVDPTLAGLHSSGVGDMNESVCLIGLASSGLALLFVVDLMAEQHRRCLVHPARLAVAIAKVGGCCSSVAVDGIYSVCGYCDLAVIGHRPLPQA